MYQCREVLRGRLGSGPRHDQSRVGSLKKALVSCHSKVEMYDHLIRLARVLDERMHH